MLHGRVRSIALTQPTFRATTVATSYLANFNGAGATEVAHDILRSVSNRRETGPWNETASARIGAQKLAAFSRQPLDRVDGRTQVRRHDNGNRDPK